MDSPLKPRDEDERALLQELVAAQHEKFVEVVKTGRPRMTTREVRDLADGRIISAQEAQERGLIDKLGYLDDAYQRISELSGFSRNRLVRYANAWHTGNNIYSNAFPVEPFSD